MKARLAKKIAHTPVERLSPRWLDRFLGSDERVYEAVRKWRKKKKKRARCKRLSVCARSLKNPMSCWINWSARAKGRNKNVKI